ncbi:hypothetical protein Kpol_1013p52 [Vanderwaltozyma polyspora DSM 70294]|uniref:Serine/threonine-protein kinase BUR1 n=1 Tax=Vanderwaltozyma polyspora (strain ATCC 22028 / DSM 70294 / BCRC 21397 / CBS 2163 / NBRC 10782 / NRRL Y-8283 / UCD 57-17) TaxID=436907 RepID=A7TH99_VANPO|nr:uncharacterized protein Kpol_1013p52 [Vanderwaltozyma polyspora DSM 70294]EDO18380.1 hypothetical protein Kpol_1013p52 [Vanderwaltozyma polyspora DSM 70294]
MSEGSVESEKKIEFKYRIGKVKQIPTVQVDPQTNLTFIELKPRSDEKLYGCTTFKNRYKEEKKLGQGTFGEVYKGVHLETQRQVAMKKIIINVEKDLFPITAQREITILRKLNHKNIIKLIEMVYDYSPEDSNSRNSTPTNSQQGIPTINKSFYMILPYMIADLSGILHNPRINLGLCDIKNMMLQLLEGINYIHCEKFMHRDIKAANILIDHCGILKLADFGLARMYYGSPPNLKYPGGAGMGAKYTSVVVTRWYRAPELVLGDKQYTTAVDMWGIGCVFAEFFEKKPILQGTSDIDQGHVIFKLMGTPTDEVWELAKYLPGAELTRTSYPETLTERFGSYLNDTGLDFLKGLLALDPYKRLTAMSAMQHPFFKEEPLPSEILCELCEESHESDIKRYKEEMHQTMSQKAPTAPQGHINEAGNNENKSGDGNLQMKQSKQDINLHSNETQIHKKPYQKFPQRTHESNNANFNSGSNNPNSRFVNDRYSKQNPNQQNSKQYGNTARFPNNPEHQKTNLRYMNSSESISQGHYNKHQHQHNNYQNNYSHTNNYGSQKSHHINRNQQSHNGNTSNPNIAPNDNVNASYSSESQQKRSNYDNQNSYNVSGNNNHYNNNYNSNGNGNVNSNNNRYTNVQKRSNSGYQKNQKDNEYGRYTKRQNQGNGNYSRNMQGDEEDGHNTRNSNNQMNNGGNHSNNVSHNNYNNKGYNKNNQRNYQRNDKIIHQNRNRGYNSNSNNNVTESMIEKDSSNKNKNNKNNNNHNHNHNHNHNNHHNNSSNTNRNSNSDGSSVTKIDTRNDPSSGTRAWNSNKNVSSNPSKDNKNQNHPTTGNKNQNSERLETRKDSGNIADFY